MATEIVVNDLLKRRAQQDAEWGGAQHDDTHDEEDWQRLISKQVQDAAGENHLADWRDRMVDIGALAIAAIEWADRKEPK
jgi:hypothetical protein